MFHVDPFGSVYVFPGGKVDKTDFDKDLYGKNLKVCFLKKIRNEKKFDSLTSLKSQLKKDEENCKRILAEDSEN